MKTKFLSAFCFLFSLLTASAVVFERPALGTGAILLVRANGQQVPYQNLGAAVSNAVAGDRVLIGPGGYRAVSNFWCAPGITIEGAGRRTTFLTNALTRGTSDPADGTLEGPFIVLNTNVVVRRLTFVAEPTINLQQNVPMLGTIYFDRNNKAPQNFLIEECDILNPTLQTVSFYIRHTNVCRGRVRDCDFSSAKNPVFVSMGNHRITFENVTAIVQGPTRIANDSGYAAADAFRFLSGTNLLVGCTGWAFDPTNALAYNGSTETNAVGLRMDTREGLPVEVTAVGCSFRAGNTNATGSKPYAIMNGGPFTSGTLYLAGCDLDNTNIVGPVIFREAPLQQSSVIVWNTNIIYVAGAEDPNANDTYTWNSGAGQYDSVGGYYLKYETSPGNAHCSIYETFGGLQFTNASGTFVGTTTAFTNTPYYDLNNGNVASALTIRFDYSYTNQYVVVPANVKVQGDCTASGYAAAARTMIGTNGFIGYATNFVRNGATSGFTNSATAPGIGGTNTMLVVFTGATSGTVEFYGRGGLNGQTIASVPWWTNTVLLGGNIAVGVNCGFVIRSPVGISYQVIPGQ